MLPPRQAALWESSRHQGTKRRPSSVACRNSPGGSCVHRISMMWPGIQKRGSEYSQIPGSSMPTTESLGCLSAICLSIYLAIDLITCLLFITLGLLGIYNLSLSLPPSYTFMSTKYLSMRYMATSTGIRKFEFCFFSTSCEIFLARWL